MKFALIGHPVAGSAGPAFYDGKIDYSLEDHERFSDAWRCFLEKYDGINVTAPYKVDAFHECRWLSPAALRCGAVNLVLKDGLRGYNTDVDGVMYALRGVSASTALVVGTGGAARAAIWALQQMGFAVSVYGRNAAKVNALCSEFGAVPCAGGGVPVIVYTLPGSAPVPAGIPFRDAIVLEAEYRHPALAGIPCRRYISGNEWFTGQALASLALFQGLTA